MNRSVVGSSSTTPASMRCAADFSHDLAVDRLIVGQTGRAASGDGTHSLIFVSLIDARTHTVLARTSWSLR